VTSEGASLDSAWGVEGVRRGGSGRKLQLLLGRAETRVKISEIRRCWTAVSLEGVLVGMRQDGRTWWRHRLVTYELSIEFGQPGLAIVVED
jgi:hypothetical protein